MSETRLHICAPGLENRLLAELTRRLPASRHALLSPGIARSTLTSDDSDRALRVAFSRQIAPRAEALHASSISRFADELLARLVPVLQGHDAPWRLHVACHPLPGREPGPHRAKLIREAAIAALKRRHRGLLRLLVADDRTPLRDPPAERIAQLVLVSNDEGWLSLGEVSDVARLGVSRLPLGHVAVPEDRGPPSRAYRKIVEALARLGREIASGETVVDLGAAPGGWTHVALAHGARVIAVDRSPLVATLMGHPRLAFVQGDAFRFTPPELPVDWLVSDVVAYPDRILQLIERWLGACLCRRFIVTVKLRGEADDARFLDFEAQLTRFTHRFELVHLDANKNEITLLGELD